MAWLKAIRGCDFGPCPLPATVELLTYRNEIYGRYCRKHGEERLKAVNDDEVRALSAEPRRSKA